MTTSATRLCALTVGAAGIVWLPSSSLAGRARQDAESADPVGVYGFVQQVELEPETGSPERMRVLGNFAVAVPGEGGYQVPEFGYLYFRLPDDPTPALDEWRESKRLDAAGFRQRNQVGATIKGRVAFGRRGERLRVRTSDDPPDRPDVYLAGAGVAMVPPGSTSPGATILWQAPKPQSTTWYAIVDRVVLEPGAGPPERMQVWGAFVLSQAGHLSYTAPQRGYLHLALPPDRRSDDEIWKSVAATGDALKLFVVLYHRIDIRIRPASEAPQAPDAYTPISRQVFRVRSDSGYAPIRSLLALR